MDGWKDVRMCTRVSSVLLVYMTLILWLAAWPAECSLIETDKECLL